MRLRDDSIALRAVTLRDVLDAGLHLDALRRLEVVAASRFHTFEDLSRPRAKSLPLASVDDEPLAEHVGAGFHQSARFRLTGQAPLRAEVQAGLHPYSGVYATQLVAHLPRATPPEALVAVAEALVTTLEPLSLHVHDADDDAMANVESPRLLALGWGEEAVALAGDRPGREWSRGHFRFAPSWLTYVHDDGAALLGVDLDALDVAPSSRCGTGRLFRLGATAEPSGLRDAQRALRAALAIDALAARDGRSFSYWKKKS